MKNLILLAALLLYPIQILTAQTAANHDLVEATECDASYQKVKEAYEGMFNSESSVLYRKLKTSFYDKIPKGINLDDPTALTCEDKILSWIEKNVEKTDFESYGQAKKDWEESLEARALSIRQNPTVYELLEELKGTCKDKVGPLFTDLIKKYGKDFYL